MGYDKTGSDIIEWDRIEWGRKERRGWDTLKQDRMG